MKLELRSKQGISLGTVTADILPETFSLDERVNLTLVFMPISTAQYPTVYRIESPGFTPDRILLGNFIGQSTQKHQFKAEALEASRISAVFYNGNYETGRVDFDFEKDDDGVYRMLD